MSNDHDKFHYQFIHNVFGCFIENTLEYFGDYLYPRFKHKCVGTYDKAVEYITKTEQLGREGDMPNLPAIIINPTGDFSLDDVNSGAHQFWRFPHLAAGQAQGLFTPIYLDNNVEVTVAFTRLKGELEILLLLPSFYEYFDLKIFLIQMFGGEGRYIEPVLFDDFIILPPELINYKYENEYTGESYTLNWKESGAYEFLVETTNQTELVIPGKVKPRYVLRGMSDGSSRYGGTDDIADWKLSCIVEYEIEIPSFIVLKTNSVIEDIHFNITYDSVYSTYPEYNIPLYEENITSHVDSGLQENKNTIILDSEGIPSLDLQNPPPLSICDGDKIKRHLKVKTRYFHKITKLQSESEVDIEIVLPEQIYDETLLKVQGKHGLLIYGTNYILEDSGKILKFIISNTSFDESEIIELFVYDSLFPFPNPIFIHGASALISTTDETPLRTDLNVKWGFRGTAKSETIDHKPDIIVE